MRRAAIALSCVAALALGIGGHTTGVLAVPTDAHPTPSPDVTAADGAAASSEPTTLGRRSADETGVVPARHLRLVVAALLVAVLSALMARPSIRRRHPARHPARSALLTPGLPTRGPPLAAAA